MSEKTPAVWLWKELVLSSESELRSAQGGVTINLSVLNWEFYCVGVSVTVMLGILQINIEIFQEFPFYINQLDAGGCEKQQTHYDVVCWNILLAEGFGNIISIQNCWKRASRFKTLSVDRYNTKTQILPNTFV